MSADGQRPHAALPGPTETELERLRRGQLAPDARAALVKRAEGLSAPWAPPESDLVPNGTGWLIGVGQLRHRQWPRLSRWFDRWGPLSVFPLLGLGQFMGSPAAIVAGGIAGIGFMLGIDICSGVSWRRQLKRARSVVQLGDVEEGTLVRVAGVIAPQETVPTLFRGVPSVLARNRMGLAEEMRGADFLLNLDGGEQAKVAVNSAFLLERPQRVREPPVCGPLTTEVVDRSYHRLRSAMFRRPAFYTRMFWGYESSVGPGVRVEVCGVVRHEHAAGGVPRSFRQVPTKAVLRAGADMPLLVRRAGNQS